MVFDIYSRFKRGEKNIIEEKEWKKYQYIASKVADEYLGKLVKGMLEEMQPLIDPEKELNRQIEEAENKLKELMAKRKQENDQDAIWRQNSYRVFEKRISEDIF